MSTHAKTTIRDEQDKPILSFYRQMDGYFEGHGEELQEFLKEFKIVNGYSSNTEKQANGMSCLAAQLVAHFKDGIGEIYICDHNNNEEYNYLIRYITPINGERAGKVSLIGKTEGETRVFPLYDEIIPSNIIKTVSFVYDKQDGSKPAWRTVEVTEETDNHFGGIEGGAFKKFLKHKILGGRIIFERGAGKLLDGAGNRV